MNRFWSWLAGWLNGRRVVVGGNHNSVRPSSAGLLSIGDTIVSILHCLLHNTVKLLAMPFNSWYTGGGWMAVSGICE